MLLGLMVYSCIISHQLSPLERRVHDIQIVIVMNFLVVSSVGIRRVDCIVVKILGHLPYIGWKICESPINRFTICFYLLIMHLRGKKNLALLYTEEGIKRVLIIFIDF